MIIFVKNEGGNYVRLKSSSIVLEGIIEIRFKCPQGDFDFNITTDNEIKRLEGILENGINIFEKSFSKLKKISLELDMKRGACR